LIWRTVGVAAKKIEMKVTIMMIGLLVIGDVGSVSLAARA